MLSPLVNPREQVEIPRSVRNDRPCSLPTTQLTSAYCFLPSAGCFLPSAYCLLLTSPKWSLKAAWAAKYPHMPCTPPPGGVEAEQRYWSGAEVR